MIQAHLPSENKSLNKIPQKDHNNRLILSQKTEKLKKYNINKKCIFIFKYPNILIKRSLKVSQQYITKTSKNTSKINPKKV